MTAILEQAVTRYAPPMVRGRRIKLNFAHPRGQNPPTIVIHGKQTDSLPDSYVKYLNNAFAEALKLVGTPVRLQFKTADNPYQHKTNSLTERQIKRRKRLMKHVKR